MHSEQDTSRFTLAACKETFVTVWEKRAGVLYTENSNEVAQACITRMSSRVVGPRSNIRSIEQILLLGFLADSFNLRIHKVSTCNR